VSVFNPAWLDDAACHGESVDLFFSIEGERRPEREVREEKAKAICARCSVLEECRAHAEARPETYGTWGGLTEDERKLGHRRALRRAQKRRAAGEAA